VFPRRWNVTIDGRTLTVVAGTREAAAKIALRRLTQAGNSVDAAPAGSSTQVETAP
jgi:gamma-glutamyltranspeptidase